jgi:hypothetical protein
MRLISDTLRNPDYRPGYRTREGRKHVANQDGADFYNLRTGEHIVSYVGLVKHDYDTCGAELARLRFLTQFGASHRMATAKELELD